MHAERRRRQPHAHPAAATKRARAVAAGIALLLATAVAAPAQGDETAADPPTVEDLARQLAEPGPEAATRRLQALNALILRPEPAAHAVLQARIRAGRDADDTALRILELLEGRIATPGDPVFGDPARRPDLLAGYVRSILPVFAASGAIAPEPVAPESLREPALRAVRVLPAAELQAALDAALAAAETDAAALRRAALQLAGQSRRVGIGPWIASRLADPELAPTARRALRELVHVAEDFVDAASFARWYEANRHRSYLELAEDAARRATERISAVESAARQRVLDLERRLVRALTDSPAPDWRGLAATILEREDRSVVPELLGALCDVLARRLRSGETPAGIGPDRAAFATGLAAALDAAATSAIPAMLEALAYVSVGAEPGVRQDVQSRLRTALLRADADLRAAALRGLSFHPGPVNRAAIVEAARAARTAGDMATLAAAFDCLLTPGWRAPGADDLDREPFIAMVESVFTDADLEVGLIERGLDVGLLRSSDDLPIPALWDRVAAMARDGSRDPGLRRLALSHLTPPSQAAGLATRYVAVLADRLGDPDPRVRRLAASLVRTLPTAAAAGDRDQWHATLVAAAEAQLPVEPDPRVIRDLADAMLAIARTAEQAARWIDALARAASELAHADSSEAAVARRAALVDALRLCALDRGAAAGAWTRCAAGLVALGARDALVDVLARHDPVTQPNPERNPAALAERRTALLVVLDTAGLAASPWDFSARDAEARHVAAAFGAIEAGGGRIREAGRAAVAAEALLAIGETARADTLAEQTLEAGGEIAPAVAARLLAVRGFADAAADRPAEAQDRLRAVERHARELPALGPRAAALRFALAAAEFRAERLSAARALLQPLLAPGVERGALWADAFLLDCGCRLGLGPDPDLIADLRAQVEWFGGAGLDPRQSAEFQELLRRASGDGVR